MCTDVTDVLLRHFTPSCHCVTTRRSGRDTRHTVRSYSAGTKMLRRTSLSPPTTTTFDPEFNTDVAQGGGVSPGGAARSLPERLISAAQGQNT